MVYIQYMRLFLAIPLTQALQQELDLWWGRESGLFPGWRTMRAENRHVTLHFLGDVEDRHLDELLDILHELFATTPSMCLAVRGLGFFPSPSGAKSFWAGLEEKTGALENCARRCRHLCQPVLGRSEKSLPFRAHITMARHSPGVNAVQLLEQLSLPPEFSWEAAEVQLMQSSLHPHGASYQVVERFTLGGEV